MKSNHTFLSYPVGLLGILFLLSLSVTVVLNARFLYYQDLDALSASTGLSTEAIQEDYDTLIDYNLFFHHEDLVFPNLPQSEEGHIHFQEVKQIFVLLQDTCLISGPLFFLAAFYLLKKQKNPLFLKITWIVGSLLPLVVGTIAFFFWDWLFVAFHQLVFRNDYWLFDPATDPIIDLLPDSYFFRCLVCIVLLLLIFTQLCGLLYWKFSRKRPA